MILSNGAPCEIISFIHKIIVLILFENFMVFTCFENLCLYFFSQNSTFTKSVQGNGQDNIGSKLVLSVTSILFQIKPKILKFCIFVYQNEKTIKLGMNCTFVYGKIVGVSLNILSSVVVKRLMQHCAMRQTKT